MLLGKKPCTTLDPKEWKDPIGIDNKFGKKSLEKEKKFEDIPLKPGGETIPKILHSQMIKTLHLF